MFHGLLLPLMGDGAAAAVAFYAALRLRRLNRLADEPRLLQLGALFLFLALALFVRIMGAFLLEVRGTRDLRAGFEVLDVFFWLRHALVFGALVAGSLAVGGPGRGRATHAPVLATVLFAAEPILLLVEGLGFAYLAVRTGLNHVRRNNLGSLEVTVGFSLLAAAWLVPPLLFPYGVYPLGPPHWLAALLGLGGVVALAAVLPAGGRPRA